MTGGGVCGHLFAPAFPEKACGHVFAPAFSEKAVLLLLLPLCLLSSGEVRTASAAKPGGECENALFETHWFAHDGSETLARAAGLRNDLRLCPGYNGRRSCCRASFEREQALHYSFWREVLASKLARLRQNRLGTLAVKQHGAFNAATEEEREELEGALQAYDTILDPKNHARCFAALLSYVAGMVCFACEPNWRGKVLFEGRHVIRVRLAESTCQELWACCEHFASLGAALRQAVLDSGLAVRQSTPQESLVMFGDQQSLCDWAHDVVALHPFTTPEEALREAAPPAKREAAVHPAEENAAAMQQVEGRRRLATAEVAAAEAAARNATSLPTKRGEEDWRRLRAKAARAAAEVPENVTSPPSKREEDEEEEKQEEEEEEEKHEGGTASRQEYDAMKAGRASGFDISWGGVLGSSGHGAARANLASAAVLFFLANFQ